MTTLNDVGRLVRFLFVNVFPTGVERPSGRGPSRHWGGAGARRLRPRSAAGHGATWLAAYLPHHGPRALKK
eukprot:6651814-Pyramimonas_sp.AAC.1